MQGLKEDKGRRQRQKAKNVSTDAPHLAFCILAFALINRRVNRASSHSGVSRTARACVAIGAPPIQGQPPAHPCLYGRVGRCPGCHSRRCRAHVASRPIF